MKNDFWMLFQARVASAITNVDSSRVRPASLDEREVGWTEEWGSTGHGGGDRDDWAGECDGLHPDSIHINIRTDHLNVNVNVNVNDKSDIEFIELHQYRPAWAEQLWLRAHGIPHVVLNSGYQATESSGALPYLLRHSELTPDNAANHQTSTSTSTSTTSTSHDANARKKNDPTSTRVCLVGRHHPGWPSMEVSVHSGSRIIDYLARHSKLSNESESQVELTRTEQEADEVALSCLLEELDVILLALRFGDGAAWEAIDRGACWAASVDSSCLPTHDENHADPQHLSVWRRWTHGFATFQAWSERTTALASLTLGGHKNVILSSTQNLFDPVDGSVDVARAKARAKTMYRALEDKRTAATQTQKHNTIPKQHTDTDTDTDTSSPLSIVDIRLFGHLAEALCDVHLVTLLADCPSLISFFKTVYEQYFSATAATAPWMEWNNVVNAANHFNRVPMGQQHQQRRQVNFQASSSSGGGLHGHGDHHYADAVELMQSLSVHCHDLNDVLRNVKSHRSRESEALLEQQQQQRKQSAGQLFHTWRMGGDVWNHAQKTTTDHNKTNNNANNNNNDGDEGIDEATKRAKVEMKKMRRKNRRNDELWISGVAIGTLAAFVFASSQSRSAN
jgi:hypothetical protein